MRTKSDIFAQNFIMVTYQIQIPDTNQQAFLSLLESLKHLGVVASFRKFEDLARPGDPLDIQHLLTILADSEGQAAEGLSIPAESAKTFVELWKRKRR